MNVLHLLGDLDISDDFNLRIDALRDLQARLDQAPADVRDALIVFSPITDRFQQQVISCTANTIRVVAPAGSGKTQTLVNRVLHQIGVGVRAERILLLTFDNAAATAIRAKLADVITQIGTDPGNVRISTLNAFGYEILKLHVPQEYKKVAPAYLQYRILKDAVAALEKKATNFKSLIAPELKLSFFLDFISVLKNQLLDPRSENAQKFADSILSLEAAHPFFLLCKNQPQKLKQVIQFLHYIFRAYERLLVQSNHLDFDDQKLRAYLCIQESASLKEIIQNLYQEVIVDEFQDINELDFAFVSTISHRSTLVVTGDDDQAIYGFRGCSPKFIINLQERLERDVKSFELSINYRNPRNIVHHARRLIEHNKYRIVKNPIANAEYDSQIKIVSSLTSVIEAKALLGFFRNVKALSPTLKYSDFAVLYRTNAQSLPLQVELILNGIPYFVRKEDNILRNEALEKLLGFLRTKIAIKGGKTPSPLDCALTIRCYFRFINAKQREGLERFFSRNIKLGLFHCLSSGELFKILPKAESAKFVEYLQKAIQENSLTATLDILARHFYGLRGMIGSLEDVLSDEVPLGEIHDLAKQFANNTEEFVNVMDEAIEKAKEIRAGDSADNGVSLLTYFRAKGRQWHTVALTTCNERLIPHYRSPIEDERRLFYVAITRASSNLYLSYVKEACGHKTEPSRFLYEADLVTS
jgi:DNA helicase-2/ATP-dependent DNA helicase PcrA